MDAAYFRDRLVAVLSDCSAVLAVGQTGDLSAPLIPGKSDIDLFVICSAVPDAAARRALYRSLDGAYERLDMAVCSGGIWGEGDIFLCGGIDVMPMYFTVKEMQGYLEEVLAGRLLEKDGRFYPIGRLASIESLNILYEKDDRWSRLVDQVKEHPAALFERWYAQEAGRMIDEEDLGRAQLRHEVLFYHQVTEEFLDHFLQALFAKNNTYFPSRKRTEQAIDAFACKPVNCFQRLLRIVELGARAETIDQSIAELRAIASELMSL